MSSELQFTLIKLLEHSQAHLNLADVLLQIPRQIRNAPIKGLPYTLWELLEHVRLSQKDILNYMIDPNYSPGNFPDDYWPIRGARMHWDRTVKGYLSDLKKIKKVAAKNNLLDSLPFGEKRHTYLREILILIDHLAYHLGQMVVILRLHGYWKN